VKIRWTTPAVEQLERIFDFIAADSPTAADRTIRRIRESIRRTAQMPFSGRVGRVSGTREIPVPRTPYLVAYRVVDNSIHVLAVFHGAESWPSSL